MVNYVWLAQTFRSAILLPGSSRENADLKVCASPVTPTPVFCYSPFTIRYSQFTIQTVSDAHCIRRRKLEFVFAFEAATAGNPGEKHGAVRAGNPQQVGGAAKNLVANRSSKAHRVVGWRLRIDSGSGENRLSETVAGTRSTSVGAQPDAFRAKGKGGRSVGYISASPGQQSASRPTLLDAAA